MNSPSLSGTAVARREACEEISGLYSGNGSQHRRARASNRLEAALEAGWLAGNLLGLMLLGLLVDHQLDRPEEPTGGPRPERPRHLVRPNDRVAK